MSPSNPANDPQWEPGEPKAFCVDVAEILAPYVEDEQGSEVEVIAIRAECSLSTIWRVLRCEDEYLDLDRADKLLVAVGRSIREVRLLLADGTVELEGEPYGTN